MELLQTIVELPGPINLAILSGVTLLLGLLVREIAKLSSAVAAFLGQYIDEVAIAVAGGIVVWLNGLLAQIPANLEGVAFAALQLVVAILAALGLLAQYRKARAFRSRGGA
jgi:hypothetical protein